MQACVSHTSSAAPAPAPAAAPATVLCRKLRWTAEALQLKRLAAVEQGSDATCIGLRTDLWDSGTRAALLALIASSLPRCGGLGFLARRVGEGVGRSTHCAQVCDWVTLLMHARG